MIEVYKWINGYEGKYEISNFGNIKSYVRRKFGKLMVPKFDKDGYRGVGLRDKNSIRKHYRIGRLVAIAFIENPNNYPFINHKDCNVKNDNVDNLEWCTMQYNNKYRFINGNASHACEKHPHTKLTNEIVYNLYYDSLTLNLTEPQLAKKYNTTRSVVNAIRLGRTWNPVTKKVLADNPNLNKSK